MKLRLLLTCVALGSGVWSARAAEEAPKSRMREAVKARMIEDAKKAPPAAAAEKPKAAADAAAPGATPSAPTASTAAAPTAKDAKSEPPTVLPKVEVRKQRITELDRQLAKQEQDIRREKKNTQPTPADLALNDMKIAKPLAIFGGESSQFRQHVANERVELMEAEKGIMEAIAQAKTKEEKAALQKQLDELRTARRHLDQTLR